MFERFTVQARHAVVLAQQEAASLGHSDLGTEHLLLGLIADPECTAAQILRRMDVEPEQIRTDVVAIVGRGTETPSGHIPFTPSAKRVLEASLREALRFGHDYIGLAQSRGASYFDIGDAWDGLSDAQRWAANQRVLDTAIANGDRIALATNRLSIRPGSALAREIGYLTGPAGGYVWLDDVTLVPGG